MTDKKVTRLRRARKARLKMHELEAVRLCVYRSSQHIYAQVIDDVKGVTIAAASTIDTDVKKSLKKTADADAAKAVGKLVAERAKKAGIEQVAFDRGRYAYHGRIKALAEAAREAGLAF